MTKELRIYDIGLDDFRPATQDDIDNYMALKRAYGKLRECFLDAHKELMHVTIKPTGKPDACDLGQGVREASVATPSTRQKGD